VILESWTGSKVSACTSAMTLLVVSLQEHKRQQQQLVKDAEAG
jgi:hypothetical protein